MHVEITATASATVRGLSTAENARVVSDLLGDVLHNAIRAAASAPVTPTHRPEDPSAE